MKRGHSRTPTIDGMTETTIARREAGPGSPPEPDMAWIPGGRFRMGSDEHYSEEAPAHQVAVDGFWIDRHTVTNREFALFVRRTGYVTVAERQPDSAQYPGARSEVLVPGSTVFVTPPRLVDLRDPYQWWRWVPDADWRRPQGPASSIRQLSDHPVVHVAWADVCAYSAWAGKDLPTEAEWEYAARGGLDGQPYAWGAESTPGGRHLANTWQGEFPMQNTGADGYTGTAPVGSYPANGYGLLDMIGNVWEWTSDWYGEHQRPGHECCVVENPRGGSPETSHDPAVREIVIPRKVVKGGSHLCAPNYCRRYRPAARMAQAIDTSTSHVGFRCMVRP
jgi:sulfatase modifying factor 1